MRYMHGRLGNGACVIQGDGQVIAMQDQYKETWLYLSHDGTWKEAKKNGMLQEFMEALGSEDEELSMDSVALSEFDEDEDGAGLRPIFVFLG